ncbi:MAG: hypothetical protein ACYDEI_03505, partial [Erysipelotrichaceae bacterium]
MKRNISIVIILTFLLGACNALNDNQERLNDNGALKIKIGESVISKSNIELKFNKLSYGLANCYDEYYIMLNITLVNKSEEKYSAEFYNFPFSLQTNAGVEIDNSDYVCGFKGFEDVKILPNMSKDFDIVFRVETWEEVMGELT